MGLLIKLKLHSLYRLMQFGYFSKKHLQINFKLNEVSHYLYNVPLSLWSKEAKARSIQNDVFKIDLVSDSVWFITELFLKLFVPVMVWQ